MPARTVSGWIGHTSFEPQGMGILKVECAVLPPFNKSAATRKDATTIFVIMLVSARSIIEFKRSVFPVPPSPSRQARQLNFLNR